MLNVRTDPVNDSIIIAPAFRLYFEHVENIKFILNMKTQVCIRILFFFKTVTQFSLLVLNFLPHKPIKRERHNCIKKCYPHRKK